MCADEADLSEAGPKTWVVATVGSSLLLFSQSSLSSGYLHNARLGRLRGRWDS